MTEVSGAASVVSIHHYDGRSNDLLSAGLGLAGIQSATPPDAQPDDAEAVRRRAIYMHYRGLIDRSDGGGFGRLYGTALANGIAGTEIVAMIPWRAQRFAAVLQIPDQFDRDHPCLVMAPASGSRNAYGALPIVGEWALPRGCALLLHDKGVGAGVASATLGLNARGQVVPLADAMWRPKAGSLLHANEPAEAAFRHLHDGAGAEADWGRMSLAALHWAIGMLQAQQPATHRYRKPALTVIAAGVSNGGAAALRAAEADAENLIDAVVAGEPNITPRALQPVQVGNGAVMQVGVAALRQFPEVGLLLPCAVASNPLLPPAGQLQVRQHCAWLRQQGMLMAVDDNALAQESAQRIRALGLPDSVFALAPVTLSLGMYQSLLATYANAAAGSPQPALCGIRAVPSQGALDADTLSRQYTDGSGLPPQDWLGAGAEKMAGLTPAQQWCLRQTIHDSPLVQQALAQQTGSGQLGGRPVIIVHGRDDALIAVQHSSRPYFALLQQQGETQARYLEILNAHHFDAFNALPGYDRLFVPIHRYFLHAMDAMWAHLKNGAALPVSQVVRTTPRAVNAGVTEALLERHVPAWLAEPAPGEAIRWQDGVLYIPQ
ncbi:MAG: 3-hydroxybutyrate oligomer hydrolase family protein [Pseudomonadota bacterium]